MNERQLIGSQTARNGFRNEDDVVDKFNNWENDPEAKTWLQIMGYNLEEIESVVAVKIYREKTDVQAQITVRLRNVIDAQNMQVKLVSNPKGFNQIDKRWLDTYNILWNIPNEVLNILKRYTGEIAPNVGNTKDRRRMFANEFTDCEQALVLQWLKDNKTMIISDILKGRGRLSAEWMLVAQKQAINSRWILKPMNYCVNLFGNEDVIITKQGNFKIGRITMQRKGGDNGRPTANMLQFKINPAELFDE